MKKNIVVHACCGHLPLCSTFSLNSTISPLVSLVKSRGTLRWKPSHPCLALSILDAFSSSHSFSLTGLPLISSIPHFPRLAPPCSARFRHIRQRFALCFTAVQQPSILFFFLQDLCSSSSCWGGFVILCRSKNAWFSLSGPLPAFQNSSPQQLLSCCIRETCPPDFCHDVIALLIPSFRPSVVDSFKPFFLYLSLQHHQNFFLPSPPTFLFLPLIKAVMSSTKTFNSNGG